jgi:hypothetical protein
MEASLALGVCLYGQAVADRATMPQTAADKAAAFVRLCEADATSLHMRALPDWLPEARAIVDEASGAKTRPQRTPSQSSAADRWEEIKQQHAKNPSQSQQPGPPKAMDRLMQMVGLESVKLAFIREYHKACLAKEQSTPLHGASHNLRLDGNPGTGKTTVAQTYAAFLVEVGVLPEGSVVECTSGSALLSNRLALATLLQTVKEAGGGVVFVDEAYQLNPQGSSEGRQILDQILGHSEKLVSESLGVPVVWVMAGYRSHLDKLFEYNPGLTSRFPMHFHLEDFTDPELLSIFKAILQAGGRDVSPPVTPNKPAGNKRSTRGSTSVRDFVDFTDDWGNKWQWDSDRRAYLDEHGNISGYGNRDTQPLGSRENPIVSTMDKSQWTFDRNSKEWSNGKITQTHYPGSPAPGAPTGPVKPFTLSDEKWGRVAMRRLGAGRGGAGFGNARAVRSFFDDCRRRQAARIARSREGGLGQVDVMRFERDDLLGPRADRARLEGSAAWAELLGMEGLEGVKALSARCSMW